MRTPRILAATALTFALSACGSIDIGGLFGGGSEPFSSDQATLLNFEFDAEFTTNRQFGLSGQAEDQLLYTIGHLNWDKSLGRLDKLVLSDLTTEELDGGMFLVHYHATLPVAWGSKTNLPTAYTFTLPRRVDYVGMNDFSNHYKDTCVDWGAHEVDAGSFWYYYRPQRSGCSIANDEKVVVNAAVSVSEENTTGKYPEYHKVWEDDALTVVAIFGKYDGGATSDSDAGISAYNNFTRSVRNLLGSGVETTPPNVPTSPGVSMPDITFRAMTTDGRSVTVNALLVDNVRTAGPTFDNRYAELSGDADLIVYSGHAGLGANIRALARKGHFVAGKYQIFFFNGCDTFAYVDSALAETKADLNPDDPTGTKYLDIVTNAMPSYFHSMSNATLALVDGLLNVDSPQTYDETFTHIDRSEVVLVTGEEDNEFYPGWDGGGDGWNGLHEVGAVPGGQWARFETPALPAGQYQVTIATDPNGPGGDADLYVRVGTPPTSTLYDCRPYVAGSDETCTLTLSAAAVLYIAVRGYDDGDNGFVLDAHRVGGGQPWTGMSESGTVGQNEEASFETPTLPAGNYRFVLAHDPAAPGGDADLYVKVGGTATASSYDCRPYLSGSDETCDVSVSADAPVFVMVRGYGAGSNAFLLTGTQAP